MTIIAYRDGLLAADTSVFEHGRTYVGQAPKIFLRRDTDRLYLLGHTGDLADVGVLQAWAEGKLGLSEFAEKLTEHGECLLIESVPGKGAVLEGNQVVWLSRHGRAILDNPFHALGSGTNIALGAMAHGASAVQAVRHACHYDACCRLPIQFLTLDGDGGRLKT